VTLLCGKNVVDRISSCQCPFCRVELNAAERATSSVAVQQVMSALRRAVQPLYTAVQHENSVVSDRVPRSAGTFSATSTI